MIKGDGIKSEAHCNKNSAVAWLCIPSCVCTMQGSSKRRVQRWGGIINEFWRNGIWKM